MEKIIVIIPTYNEADNIGKMLDILIKEEFPKIKNYQMAALVVDDNSPDGTAKIVREKMRLYNKNRQVISLLEGKKEGLGKAFARGMKHAMVKLKADAVVEVDADFQHDPKDVKRLVAEFSKGYDYVIGSRYIKGGAIPRQWQWYRKLFSWGGSLFARMVLLLVNVHDVTSGFKLTKVKGFLDKVDLENLLSNSYAYKIHILYEVVKEKHARVSEVPIIFRHRERGSSKIEKDDLIDSFRVTMILFFRSRFFKFGIVGFIGFTVNAVSLEIIRRVNIFAPISEYFSYLADTKFTLLSQPTAWSAAAAGEMAIISNFSLNNTWTFAKEQIRNPFIIAKRFLEFNATSLGAIVIQFVVIGTAVILFEDVTKVRQLGLLVALSLIIPYNYTMYNVFIWRRWRIPWLPFLK